MILFGGLIAGRLLLAFSFKVMSRNIRDQKLSDYLSIASRGIAILFVAFYANVSSGSYLPFGILALSSILEHSCSLQVFMLLQYPSHPKQVCAVRFI